MDIHLKNLEQICFICPCSYKGITNDGKQFYFKSRYGKSRVEINKEIVLMTNGDMTYTAEELVSHLQKNA